MEKLKKMIKAMWEKYHGPVEIDGEEYIPAPPPLYERGFLDGYNYALNPFSDEGEEAQLERSRAFYEK